MAQGDFVMTFPLKTPKEMIRSGRETAVQKNLGALCEELPVYTKAPVRLWCFMST
jgi:hypothetical protein